MTSLTGHRASTACCTRVRQEVTHVAQHCLPGCVVLWSQKEVCDVVREITQPVRLLYDVFNYDSHLLQ